MCNTYGTWVQGDARGWRERHHRKHVEGDYRHPPKKGTFEIIEKQSELSMKRDPVHLDRELRDIALQGIVQHLKEEGVNILVACLDATHLHVLGQFKDLRPRQRLGWAKFFATKLVKESLNAHGSAVRNLLELKEGQGLWGKRSQSVPIRDRAHRLNTLNYIASHQKKGAAIWLNPELRGRKPTI
jgi:hypothetical protein